MYSSAQLSGIKKQISERMSQTSFLCGNRTSTAKNFGRIIEKKTIRAGGSDENEISLVWPHKSYSRLAQYVLRGRPFDSGGGGGGGWQFLEINILAAKNLKINNLSCVPKKIKK